MGWDVFCFICQFVPTVRFVFITVSICVGHDVETRYGLSYTDNLASQNISEI